MSGRVELVTAILSAHWPNGDLLDGVTRRTSVMIADAILASDWLADHDAEIREQIAQEIEAGVLPSHPSREYRDGFERAAQIARTSEPTL